MFCPNCGANEQQSEAYCRSCGEWLPDLKKSVSLKFGGSSPEENIQHSLWLSSMSAIVCIIFAVAIYVTYLGTDNGTPLIYLTAAFLLALAGWQISNVFITLKLRRHLVRRRSAKLKTNLFSVRQNSANVLPAADTSDLVYQSSVTENTTNRLEPILRKQQN